MPVENTYRGFEISMSPISRVKDFQSLHYLEYNYSDFAFWESLLHAVL
jgi:hypothetical protein